MRLPYRGVERIFARIETTSRESDLSSMGPHMLSPDGEDHAWLRPVGNRDQDRGKDASLRSQFG